MKLLYASLYICSLKWVGVGCRALHWVTIEMLCVPVDEEIPEVSDNVVKAITGQTYNILICF